MNLDHVGGLIRLDPVGRPWPAELIAALPDGTRAGVDEALGVLGRLEASEVDASVTPDDVVRGVSERLLNAAEAGDQFDLLADAGAAVQAADALKVASVAHSLAVTAAKDRVHVAVAEAAVLALPVWTRRVQAIAVDVDGLLGEGAILDELTARRGTKTDVSRWERLTGLLAEWDQIRSAFSEARLAINPSDQRERFAVDAYFMGVLAQDERLLAAEVEQSRHVLIAGIRLGWTPWCPSLEEQLAVEQDTIRTRREGAPPIPGDAILA